MKHSDRKRNKSLHPCDVLLCLIGHISPILRSLHCLPVKSRIHYNILPLTFKSLNNQAPSYLFDLIHLYIPSRQLRSSADTRPLRLPSAQLSQVLWSMCLLLPSTITLEKSILFAPTLFLIFHSII